MIISFLMHIIPIHPKIITIAKTEGACHDVFCRKTESLLHTHTHTYRRYIMGDRPYTFIRSYAYIRSLSHWLTVYFSMLTWRNLSYVLFRSCIVSAYNSELLVNLIYFNRRTGWRNVWVTPWKALKITNNKPLIKVSKFSWAYINWQYCRLTLHFVFSDLHRQSVAIIGYIG